MCWGEDTVSAAEKTADLEGARSVLAKAGAAELKRDGSIVEAFECIGKETVAYSQSQLTYTETR